MSLVLNVLVLFPEGGIYEDVEHVSKEMEPVREEDGESKSSDDSSPTKHVTMLDVLGYGGSLHRALWCEMPEVRLSLVLSQTCGLINRIA